MKLIVKTQYKRDAYYGILLLPLLKMLIVSMTPNLELLFNVLLVLISIVFLFRLSAKYTDEKKTNVFALLLVLYNFSVIPFSVSAKNLNIQSIVTFYGSTLYHVTFGLSIMAVLRYDSRRMLHSWRIIMEIVVLLNAFSIVAYPNGLYTHGTGYQLVKYWLLGYDNAHVIPYILTLLLAMIDSYSEKKKVFTVNVIFLYSVCLGVSLYLWTVTSFISLLLLGMLCALYKMAQKISRIFNIATLTLFIVAVMLIIFYFALIGSKTGVIARILVDTLHKDITFNSRSWIWENYLVNIRNHLLFGNGYETAEILMQKNVVNSAHNEWLQMLYDGGIFHFVFYLCFLCTMINRMLKYRREVITYLISCAIFAIMIIQMMVECPKFYWLVLYIMGYCCLEIAYSGRTMHNKR